MFWVEGPLSNKEEKIEEKWGKMFEVEGFRRISGNFPELNR